MQDEIKGLRCVQSTVAVVPMEEAVVEWVISKGKSGFFYFFIFCSELRGHTPSFCLLVVFVLS